jgi:hypothetical protein
MLGSAQDYWSAYIFATKFKQIMPFCIISWSRFKTFYAEWGVVVGADQCRAAGAEQNTDNGKLVSQCNE